MLTSSVLLSKKKKWGKHEFEGESYSSRYLRELTYTRKEVCQVIGKKWRGGGGVERVKGKNKS